MSVPFTAVQLMGLMSSRDQRRRASPNKGAAVSLSLVGPSEATRVEAVGMRNMQLRMQSQVLIGIVVEQEDQRDFLRSGAVKVFVPAIHRLSAPSDVGRGGLLKVRLNNGVYYITSENTIDCLPVWQAGGAAGEGGETLSSGVAWMPRGGDQVLIAFHDQDSRRAFYLGVVPPPRASDNLMTPGGRNRESCDDVGFWNPAVDDDQPPKASPKSRSVMNQGLARHPVYGHSPAFRDKSGASGPMMKDAIAIQSRGYPEKDVAGNEVLLVDHEPERGVRVRSSGGAQLMLSDAAKTIFAITQSGSAWLEMSDSGDVKLFCEGSFSVHAKKNIDITAGEDVNVVAGRDLNADVAGHAVSSIAGDLDTAVAGESRVSHVGKLSVKASAGYDLDVVGDLREKASGEMHLSSTGQMRHHSAASLHQQDGATAPSVVMPKGVRKSSLPGVTTIDDSRKSRAGAPADSLDGNKVRGKKSGRVIPQRWPMPQGASPADLSSAAPQLQPAVFTAGAGAPVPELNNNLLGMEKAGFSVLGQANASELLPEHDPDDLVFKSPEYGFAEGARRMGQALRDGGGRATLGEVVGSIAPGDSAALAAVSSKLGVAASDDLPDDFATITSVSAALAEHRVGRQLTPQESLSLTTGAQLGGYSPTGVSSAPMLTSSSVRSSTPISGRQQQAYNYFIGQGWTPAQASGLVGNLTVESGLNPTAYNAGEDAIGIAQWRNERITTFETDFAPSVLGESKQLEDATFEEQLQYVQWELENTEASAASSLAATTTSDEASDVVMTEYERAATGSGGARRAASGQVASAAGAPTTSPESGVGRPYADSGGYSSSTPCGSSQGGSPFASVEPASAVDPRKRLDA